MRQQPNGRLELTWVGKDSALIPSENGKYDYAWVNRDDPRVHEIRSIETVEEIGELEGQTGARENLLIVGESADALRSLGSTPELTEKYLGNVKLVYIDPPFNTEQAFEHYADQLEHSVWLTMMRDRIRLIKPLMAPDASIWVHLDDREVHRMRILLDEEFGADNHVTNVIWRKGLHVRNDAKGFSSNHDTLLVYSLGAFQPNKFGPTTEMLERFSSPDGDSKVWQSVSITAPGGHTHQGMVYGVQHPITGEILYPSPGRHWSLQQSSMLRNLQEYANYELRNINDQSRRAKLCGLLEGDVRQDVEAICLVGDIETSRVSAETRISQGSWPQVFFTGNGQGGLRQKGYIPDGYGRVPETIWDNAGRNDLAKLEIQKLFPGVNAFATPKPEELLRQVIQVSTNPGDLVLDCFAGSGTTAAVAHKLGRRWVTIELQDDTVQTFTKPRLVKVVQGEDSGGITFTTVRTEVETLPEGVSPNEAHTFNTLLNKIIKGNPQQFDSQTLKNLRKSTRTSESKSQVWSGGGGFTVARLGPSMYEVNDDLGMTFLSDAATGEPWARAVAAQLRFKLLDHPVFVGSRGRQRLVVIDGVVDEQTVRTSVENLKDDEKTVIVGKAALAGADQLLTSLSKGSKLLVAPDDLFQKKTVS